MNDPAQQLANLAWRAIERSAAGREENNRRFPIVVIVKPAIERVFGPCKVTYAENYETGDKIGVQQRFLPWPDFGKYGDPR